jgi:nitrate reductase gamma subunit
MEHDLRLTIFWIVHLAMLGLFVVMMAFVVSVWLKARVPGLPANASRWRKLGVTIGFVFGLVFSRRIWTLLKALVVDGMVHRRLFRTSFQRWLVHIAVFGSFLILGVISTITGVVVEFLPLFGMSPEQAASLPLIGHMFHADVWWVALVNEVLGLVVLLGMLFVIYRRFIARDPQLKGIPADNLMIILLTLVAFSGFPAETFRLLADYTTAAGVFQPDPTLLSPEKLPPVLYPVWGPQWGFVGYLFANLLGGLGVSAGVWAIWHNVSFWSHFVIVTALLYYLPFSRFFHVIASPVIVAYNTMRNQEAHTQDKGTQHAAPLRPAL